MRSLYIPFYPRGLSGDERIMQFVSEILVYADIDQSTSMEPVLTPHERRHPELLEEEELFRRFSDRMIHHMGRLQARPLLILPWRHGTDRYLLHRITVYQARIPRIDVSVHAKHIVLLGDARARGEFFTLYGGQGDGDVYRTEIGRLFVMTYPSAYSTAQLGYALKDLLTSPHTSESRPPSRFISAPPPTSMDRPRSSGSIRTAESQQLPTIKRTSLK